MDRPGSLGNSVDAFGRRALHTKIGNKPNESIPVYITTPAGEEFFAQVQETTDPGNDKIILTGQFTNETLLSKLDVSCRAETKITFSVDGEFIAALRTGAAKPNASFQWEPKRTFPAGSTYEVKIKQRPESPIQDCEAHLMGLQQTT